MKYRTTCLLRLSSRLHTTLLGLLLTGVLVGACRSTDAPPSLAPSPSPPPAASTAITATPPTPTATLLPSGTLAGAIVDEFGVQMVLIPEGIFLMGTEDDSADAHEKPPHEVYTDAVYMDVFEASNSLFQSCVEAGACQQPTLVPDYQENPAFADYPAVNVTWEMANSYCAWRGARLPTEAQWEKAARWNPETDSVSTYPWGEQAPSSRYANSNGRVGGTTPVGSYENGKSALGLYDMAGNVLEWASDAYAFGYYADSPSFNPTGPSDDTGSRVLRGGSFADDDFYARTTARAGQNPNWQGAAGVRCAKSP